MLGTDDIDVQGLGERQGVGRQASLTVGRTAAETAAAFDSVCEGLQRVRIGLDDRVAFTPEERQRAYQTPGENAARPQ